METQNNESNRKYLDRGTVTSFDDEKLTEIEHKSIENYREGWRRTEGA